MVAGPSRTLRPEAKCDWTFWYVKCGTLPGEDCNLLEELEWSLLAPLRFDATCFDLGFELGLGFLVLSSLWSKVLCLALHLKYWCLLRHWLIWWPCWRHNLQSWYCWTIPWRFSIGNDLNFWHLRREWRWFGHSLQMSFEMFVWNVYTVLLNLELEYRKQYQFVRKELKLFQDGTYVLSLMGCSHKDSVRMGSLTEQRKISI